MKDCKHAQGPLRCVSKEYGVVFVAIASSLIGWMVITITTTQAKAERVIKIEEKVDYIYQYLMEKKEK